MAVGVSWYIGKHFSIPSFNTLSLSFHRHLTVTHHHVVSSIFTPFSPPSLAARAESHHLVVLALQFCGSFVAALHSSFMPSQPHKGIRCLKRQRLVLIASLSVTSLPTTRGLDQYSSHGAIFRLRSFLFTRLLVQESNSTSLGLRTFHMRYISFEQATNMMTNKRYGQISISNLCDSLPNGEIQHFASTSSRTSQGR
jgi:hypothetical protein